MRNKCLIELRCIQVIKAMVVVHARHILFTVFSPTEIHYFLCLSFYVKPN